MSKDQKPKSGMKGHTPDSRHQDNLQQSGQVEHEISRESRLGKRITVDLLDGWSIANRISLLAAIISLSAGIVTLLLFNQATTQTSAALRAANAADSSLAITQKEFEADNKSYLQVYSIFDSLRVGTPAGAFVKMSNVGKQPIILLTDKIKIKYRDRVDYNNLLTEKDDSSHYNIILPAGQSIVVLIQSFTLTKEDSNIISNSHEYILGQVKYINPTIGQTRLYEFEVEMTRPGMKIMLNQDRKAPE